MTTYTNVFGSDTIPNSDESYSAVALTADATFYWPELSQGDNLVTSIMDVSATGGFSITLPPANQVSKGRTILIRNTGGTGFNVKDNTGASLAVISAGVAKYLYLQDNSTFAGVWGVFTFGTGTSEADAVVLAGNGLMVEASKLAIEYEIEVSAGAYAVSATDRARVVSFTGTGAVSCTLPETSSIDEGFFFMLTNQGSGSVTVDPYSTELVDGQSTKAFAPGESAFIICTGTSWVSVGYGRSTEFQFTALVKDLTGIAAATLTSAEASNKLLQFIGAPSAATTITVPSVVAVYYVQISTSNAYTVTIKTAAGTGVTFNQNDKIVILCDGVNVTYAQTVAAVNLVTATGTLAIVNGGTGGTSASAARTNLGLVIGTDVQAYDPTLDGLAVLDTSSGLVRQTGATSFTKDAVPNGIIKGDGTTISLATSGTDYLAPPAGTALLKANSGGALASAGAVPNGMAKGDGSTISVATDGTDYLSPSTGSAQGKQTIWIPAAGMLARTTNGAVSGAVETTTNKIMLRTLDFADGATSLYAQFGVRMPKSWNASTVTASFVWTANSTSTNNVVWQIQAVALANDETIDTAFGTAVTVTDANTATAYQAHLSAETGSITIGSTPASQDWVIFQVFRDPTNASDTLAATALLLGVNIFYTTNAKNDA